MLEFSSHIKVLGLPIFAVLVFFLSFSIHDAHATTFTATQSGNWNDSETWGGSSPPTTVYYNDAVTIPTGISVTIQKGIQVLNHYGTINNAGGTININNG